MNTKMVQIGIATTLVVSVFFLVSPTPGEAAPYDGKTQTQTPRRPEPSLATRRPAIATRSSSFSIPIIQYNMCSSACSSNRAESRNVLTYIANSAGAWSVSVNEACISDLNHLAGRLGLGGRMVFSISNTTNNNNCPGADNRFGNIVFYKGPYINGTASYLSNPDVNCAFDECRAMICIRMNSFVGQIVSCSSHFINGNVPLAQEQATEFIYISTVFSGSTPQWLAGDFNLTLSPSQVPVYYSNSHTLAVFGNTAPSPNPNRQIDYIWIEGNVNVGYHTPFCPSGASDHCLVSGDQII